MRFQAMPIQVTAYPITQVGAVQENGDVPLTLSTGTSINKSVTATLPMLARYVPVVGDYWVIQDDGYVSLNPKAVFERKYTPLNGQAPSPIKS